MQLDAAHVPAAEIARLVALPHVRIHFSQFGEDGVLWHYFFGRRNGFYVDIGCHDPFRYSNTALLHVTRGWHGINVDADPETMAAFRQWRPDDCNLHMGVGLIDEIRPFSIFPSRATNTFDPAVAARLAAKQPARIEQIQIRRLDGILAEHLPEGRAIDYLNIDVEGFDDAVVRSNDWARFRPELVSVELHGFNPARPFEHPTAWFIMAQGYTLMSHCIMTTFFRRSGS